MFYASLHLFLITLFHRVAGWSGTSDPESTSQVGATTPGSHYSILPQNIQHGSLTHQDHVHKLQEFSILRCRYNPLAVNCLNTGWYMNLVSFKIIIAPTDLETQLQYCTFIVSNMDQGSLECAPPPPTHTHTSSMSSWELVRNTNIQKSSV